MSETFKSERAPEPVGAFPHAKRVGGLLFLSGIGPRVRGSKEIPGVTLDSSGNVVSYDIETQCHAVFENVRLVLEDAGATWQDIIDVTVFLTDMKKDFPIYNRIYAEYFAGHAKPNPTRTTIEVTALPTPIAIELKVIAAAGSIQGTLMMRGTDVSVSRQRQSRLRQDTIEAGIVPKVIPHGIQFQIAVVQTKRQLHQFA